MTADGDGITKSRLDPRDPGGFSFARSWAVDARRAASNFLAFEYPKIRKRLSWGKILRKISLLKACFGRKRENAPQPKNCANGDRGFGGLCVGNRPTSRKRGKENPRPANPAGGE